MIGKVTRGRGFKGLLTYLLQGQDGKQQDRVAWASTRNLVVDPEFAPSIMRSTAAENPRVEKPVYHLSISLDPNERLEPDVLRGVAERTLRDLGLEHHQAVLVAHEDTEHQHVHVMVNRVDPATRKAWRAGHDYARIEKSLRQQERELGLRQVPGRHFSLDGGDRHREARASSGSRRLAERTGKRPFGEHVRAVARRDMLEARTWDELHRRLGEVGLRLEKRGRGLVVTDGGERVKASFVDRKASLAALERRLETYEPSRRNFPAGKSERWRQIQSLRTVVGELARRTEAKRSRRAERFHQQASQHSEERLEGRIRAASAAFDQRLEEVYRDPRKARQAFEKALRRHGERRALGQLARDPEKLGRLRGRGGPFASAERWAAIEAAPHAASAARSVLSARALRKAPLAQKVARRVRDAGRTSARQLKRTAAKLLKHVGRTLAARALTAPQYQLEHKKVEPNSSLGAAFSYMLKRWDKLTLFLRQPSAPLDNNICERALKKAILHRKNALFYKTENGARVGDIFMSLIYTAELSGVNPFDYLTQLLKHSEKLRRSPQEWMPWNYQTAVAVAETETDWT